jgi:hypothetical protein
VLDAVDTGKVVLEKPPKTGNRLRHTEGLPPGANLPYTINTLTNDLPPGAVHPYTVKPLTEFLRWKEYALCIARLGRLDVRSCHPAFVLI